MSPQKEGLKKGVSNAAIIATVAIIAIIACAAAYYILAMQGTNNSEDNTTPLRDMLPPINGVGFLGGHG